MSRKSSYDQKFKKSLVTEFLTARRGDPDMTTCSFLEARYPDIPASTFYVWISRYKAEAGAEAGLSPNEIENKYGTEANDLPLGTKFEIVMETAGLSEEDRGAYCRQKGIYGADLERWRQEVLEWCGQKEALSGLKQAYNRLKDKEQTHTDVIDRQKDEISRLNKEVSEHHRILADYATNITLLENFHQLFKGKEDD